MNQENSGVKIKKVSFEWKEINKSELASNYRVSCKVTTDNGLEVEGSHFYKWSKPGADFSSPFNYGNAETNAEREAFNLALSRVQAIISFEIFPQQNNSN